jgi:hypothetical protein
MIHYVKLIGAQLLVITTITLSVSLGKQTVRNSIDDRAIKEMFSNEWNRLSAAPSFSCTYTKSTTDLINNKTNTTTHTLSRFGTCFINETIADGNVVNVSGANSKYIFIINSKKDDTKQLVLSQLMTFSEIDTAAREMLDAQIRIEIDGMARDHLKGPLLTHPFYRLLDPDIVKVTLEAMELTQKVKFQNWKHSGSTVSGEFLVNCTTRPHIAKAQYTLTNGNYSMMYSHQYDVDELNRLISATHEFIEKRNNKETRSIREILHGYNYDNAENIDNELRYTVSHYGLPEPEGIVWEKPTPWWIYLIAGAIALFVTGIALAWFARRKLKKSQPPVA